MQYTLTKYLTADYLRENDFLRAYLDLVDEIIFCCNMEAMDILSTMSFENMDDDYFLSYMTFFLDGLSTYDVNDLDKLVLSEWFSLLHVRGELSDIDKLLKFGGSLKNKEKNVFELYHAADVPDQTIDTTKDGLIYLITENNIDIDQDYLINQQIPAGYRIGLMRTPNPFVVTGGDTVNLDNWSEYCIHVNSGDPIFVDKLFSGDLTFYRRRQFDQYYYFTELYRSQYTIKQLSDYHRSGYYFFGFEVELFEPIPSDYSSTQTVYGGIDSYSGVYYIGDGEISQRVDQCRFGLMDSDSEYELLPFDSSGSLLLEATGIIKPQAEIIDDNALDWVENNNNELLQSSLYYVSGSLTSNNSGDLWYVDNDLFSVLQIDIEPQEYLGDFILFDEATGSIVQNVKTDPLVFSPTGYFTIDGSDDVVFVEQSPYPIRCNYSQVYSPNPTIADGGTLAFDYPQYASKLYIPIVITINQGAFTTYYYGWDMGNGVVVNNDGESLTVFSIILVFIDSANASIVTVVDGNNSFRRAFKYTLNGTDYYYVVDGENEFWTDDLLDIDYTLYPWPIVRSHSGAQTAASVAVDASFDTGMEWDANKLYIGETNDGQGNVTRYGWKAEEGTPGPVEYRGYIDSSRTDRNLSYTVYGLYDDSGNAILTDNNASNYQGVKMCRADGTVTYSTAFGGFYKQSDGTLAWNNRATADIVVAYLVYTIPS